jgi:hypothetical protein
LVITPVEFLKARWDEEAHRVDTIPAWRCTNSTRGDAWGTRGDCPLCGQYMFDGTEVVTEEAYWDHMEKVHRRSYVLADLAAKRRLIELAEEATGLDMSVDLDRRVGPRDEVAEPMLGNLILRVLCLPFADHPDYQQEWAVQA